MSSSIKVADFFARLGVKADTKILNEFDNGLAGIKKSVLSLARYALPALSIAGFGLFAKSAYEATKSLITLSEQMGITAQQTEQLQLFAKLTGNDFESLQTAITILNKKIGESGQGMAEVTKDFAKFGIQTKDVNGNILSAVDLLPQVANAIEKAGTQTERTAIMMRLFKENGAALLPLFQKGKIAIEDYLEQAATLSVITDENVESAKEFGFRFSYINTIISQVMLKIKFATVQALLPMTKTFEQFLRVNREFIKSNLEHVATGVSNAFQVLGRVIGIVKNVVVAFVNIVKSLPKPLKEVIAFVALLTIALHRVTLAWIAAVAPIAAVVAAITAVILVYEDYLTFIQGGESIIGKLMNSSQGRWRLLGNVLYGIGKIVKWVFDGIGQELDKIMRACEIVTDFVIKITSKLKGLFSKNEVKISSTARIASSSAVPPAFALAGNKNTTVNNNVSVRSSPTINVPRGTSEDQAAYLSREVERKTREVFQREINNSAAEFPQVE